MEIRTRVLFAGDSAQLNKLTAALGRAGYDVMLAFNQDGVSAVLKLFPPAVVLLHSKNGDLLQYIQRTRPNLPVVFTGGKTRTSQAQVLANITQALSTAKAFSEFSSTGKPH
jgi:DNA-binding NtrC family response regulator